MNRARAWSATCTPVLAFAAMAFTGPVAAAPAVFQSGLGRFEVSAVDATMAHTVVDLAADCWQQLAGPFGLPEAFSSPVFCRLVPVAEWGDATPFRVIVESGGVVSLRLRAEATLPDALVRRVPVQALLMRLAVAQHGVSEKLAAPLWLELGGVEWWRTRAEPAQFDALKQVSARLAPPALSEILDAQRGAAAPAGLVEGSVWLLTFLQSESGRGNDWLGFLHQLLGGDEAATALAATYAQRFSDESERELWWQTGWHQLRRARSLPALEAEESQQELAALGRFVFATDEGGDVVTPLRVVLAHGREPIVAAELQRRAAELNRLLPSLHSFFRNAGLSLADALAWRGADSRRQESMVAAFEGDWRDALELTAASRTALDALERRKGVR